MKLSQPFSSNSKHNPIGRSRKNRSSVIVEAAPPHWVIVPSDKIVQDYAPDGQPYLFMLAGLVSERLTPRGPFVRGRRGEGHLHDALDMLRLDQLAPSMGFEGWIIMGSGAFLISLCFLVSFIAAEAWMSRQPMSL